MRRYRTLFILLGVAALMSILGWLLYSHFFNGPPIKVYTHIPAGEMRHSNTRVGFSFAIPNGLTAEEGKYGSEEVRYVRLRDADKAIVLMLIATPIDTTVATYSLEEARMDAPRATMLEPETIEPIPGVIGIAFSGKNPLWPGMASTERWFRFGGYRYQLATPGDEALLDFVLSTWRWDAMNLPLTAPVGT